MKKKKNKQTTVYDINGRWVEERGRIKGAMRRAFRLSPQMKEVLTAARVELPPAIKKDGKPGKKNQVRYRCAGCGQLFSQKNVQVDHIDTVVPLHMKEETMTYDDLARGIFCKIDNLQVLCSTPLKQLPKGEKSCHGIKSVKENFIRDRYQEYYTGTLKVPSHNLGDLNRFFEQLYLEDQAKKKQELLEKQERMRLREEKRKTKK